MRALIVDDEVKSRETLYTLVTKYCSDITESFQANNVTTALQQIETHCPQIVFLDISMPGGSGFELLKQLPQINFETVFVTAYDTYAIEAIKANALDYILKPASIEDLKAAIQKAKNRINEKRNTNSIQQLISQLHNDVPQNKKLAIPSSDGFSFVKPKEIIHLNAEGSYTRIALTNNKSILSTRNLKEYEEQLPDTEFIRVHHSYIINVEHITHYHRGEGGYVTMVNGAEISISKRKKKDFLDRI